MVLLEFMTRQAKIMLDQPGRLPITEVIE